MSTVARGNLQQRPYGHFVWALASQSFSGRLALLHDNREYWVRFNRGQIVDASSPLAGDSLAKMALKAGLATSSQVSQLLSAVRADPGANQRSLLAEMASLSPEQVRKLDVHRIAQAAMRTFALPGAQFTCTAEAVGQEIGVITVEYVIFHGLRAHYDERRLLSELGALSGRSFQLAPRATERLPAFAFGREAESIIDGLRAAPVTAKELATSQGIDRHLLLCVLYSLWATHLLSFQDDEAQKARSTTKPLDDAARKALAELSAKHMAGTREVRFAQSEPVAAPRQRSNPAPDPAAPRPMARPEPTEPIRRHRAAPTPAAAAAGRAPMKAERALAQARGSHGVKLERTGKKLDPAALRALITDKLAAIDGDASHFELLEVSEGASSGELQKSYFRLAKSLHPDRVSAAGLDIDPRDVQRVFARINRAFTELTDPGKREHYMKVLRAGGELAYRKQQEEAERKARAILEAEEHFLAGEMARRRQQWKVAAEQYARAVDLNPNEGEHHIQLAWARWMDTSAKDAALASDIHKTIERGLRSSPKCADGHYYLGQLAKYQEQHRAALKHFQKTLELSPSHNEAQLEIRLLRSRNLV